MYFLNLLNLNILRIYLELTIFHYKNRTKKVRLPMKPTTLTIQELFADEAKLTFLVGAGSSVDAPSCLSAGSKMMKANKNLGLRA